VFPFLKIEVKLYLALVEKTLLKKGGYIRIIIQKRRINLNSRDISQVIGSVIPNEDDSLLKQPIIST
jgi:hypothetical protein